MRRMIRSELFGVSMLALAAMLAVLTAVLVGGCGGGEGLPALETAPVNAPSQPALRPGQVELFERCLPDARVVVERQAEQGPSTGGRPFVQLPQYRELLLAGAAPACPEIHYSIASAEVGQ